MEKRTYLILFTLITLLTACAGTKSTYVNGKKAYVIECTGRLMDDSDCSAKAQKLCPNGFNVLSSSSSYENPYPVNMPGGFTSDITQANPQVFGITEFTISCK